MNVREPSKLEMQVLSVLWQRGPSTVRDVLDGMPDGKTRAYTTILSVMQVMERKGLLAHINQGNAHVYSPRVSQREIAGPLLQNLERHVFGGSASSALQHLLADTSISQDELDEIKRVISAHSGETSKRATSETQPEKQI